MVACGAQVDEGAGSFELVEIFGQSSKADFDEAGVELHQREEVLHARAYFGTCIQLSEGPESAYESNRLGGS